MRHYVPRMISFDGRTQCSVPLSLPMYNVEMVTTLVEMHREPDPLLIIPAFILARLTLYLQVSVLRPLPSLALLFVWVELSLPPNFCVHNGGDTMIHTIRHHRKA